MKNIIVIDDFYEKPEVVRNLALKADYLESDKTPLNFVGTESKKSFYSDSLIKKIEKSIGKNIVVDPIRYSFGVFSKSFSTDQKNLTVHLDACEWTALVYLSLPEHCQGGTHFYVHPLTGTSAVPELEKIQDLGFSTRDDFIAKTVVPIGKDLSQWQESVRVKMKFNRMIIFKSGSLFHAGSGCFGSDDANCRLTQLFFFKTGEKI